LSCDDEGANVFDVRGSVLRLIAAAGFIGSLALLAGASGSTAKTSNASDGGTCFGPATGTMTYSAGRLGQTRTFRATFRARYECRTSDPSITSVIETGTSTGWLNCLTLTGSDATEDTFSWNNGRKSKLSYVQTIRYGISEVTGRFVRGQFKGLPVRFDGIVGAGITDLCATTKAGTTWLVYAGYGRFGAAL
jgi:hypothetical protein